MRTLLRILGMVVAGIALFLIIVSNYGTVESRLECSGRVVRDIGRNAPILPVITPATLYANVDTYRWFLFTKGGDGKKIATPSSQAVMA